jgi:hypothetical protein
MELTRHCPASTSCPAPPRARGLDVAWPVDLVERALRESSHRRTSTDPTLPEPFCLDVGRRLLLAQLELGDWVLRRVEKVEFQRDRSVTRRISIELLVREDAPVFVDSSGREFWLVPLSLMRRRTLVNLDLHDEQGHSIPLPGLRVQQQLDQSILLAAAATVDGRWPTSADLRRFVQLMVAGTHEEVQACANLWDGVTATRPRYLADLAADPLVSATVHRLRRNFTLYLALPTDEGRHRLLWMCFDEPTDWRYQCPRLEPTADGTWEYETNRPVPLRQRLKGMSAAFGLSPSRIRFQIPSAENAASYHFELTAPHGLRIVKASLLAGRPNDPAQRVSVDHVVGHSPTVGLHAVEVPTGSLCRVQADVRVPTTGWLTTMLISCWAIFLVLASVLYHWWPAPPRWENDEGTNNVLLLITTSAGVATLLAQVDFQGLPARLLTRIRAVAVVDMALPVATAGFVTYSVAAAPAQRQTERLAIIVLTALALAVALLTSTAWLRTWWDERGHTLGQSPWDMTEDSRRDAPPDDFADAVRKYRFDSAAIGIKSAEGWHEHYLWTDSIEAESKNKLTNLDV